jgi:hypothetical protein
MKDLSIRPLQEGDYENILCKWWEEWKWTAPEKDFLPQSGTGGLIVYDENTPICAGFMYVTNSGISWIEFIVSNKNYREKPTRKEAITYLIANLTEIAKNSGYRYCYAVLKNQPLIEIYKSLGYLCGDKNIVDVVKKLY